MHDRRAKPGCLGWDFAFELNEIARQEVSRAGIELRFWKIPREVLEKRAVEQGDVRFFELAALATDFGGGRIFRNDPMVPAELEVFWDFDCYLGGVDIKVIQEMLGHSSIGITLDTYGHVTPGLRDHAVGAQALILGG